MSGQSLCPVKLIEKADRFLARSGGRVPLAIWDEPSEECLERRPEEIMNELRIRRFPEEAAGDGANTAFLLALELQKTGLAALLSPIHRAALLWGTATTHAELYHYQPSRHARLRFEPGIEPVARRGEVEVDSLLQWWAEGLSGLLNLLTDRQREIVEMRHNDDRTFEQIGKRFGITRQVARARYRAAIKKLQAACPL